MTTVFAGQVPSPFAAVWAGRLEHNVRVMQSWCSARGVELAPHGKTTMAPDIFRRQLAAGAWGLTVASPGQARVAVAAGARRVLVANEVVDPAGIAVLRRLLDDDPELGLWCYVDSLDGVALLDSALLDSALLDGALLDGARRGAAAAEGVVQRLGVLIELGQPGMRAGLRDDLRGDEAALDVARAVATTRSLRLAGVAGFEGLTAPGGHPVDTAATVEALCRRIVALTARCVAEGLLDVGPGRPAIVSAGGSLSFDTVAATLAGASAVVGAPTVAVLRSGCYVTHDHGLYSRGTPAARGGDGPRLRAALEVCARVLSRPEPTRAILDAGRRDLSYDADLPVPLWARGGGPDDVPRGLDARVVALSDQHAWLDLPPDQPLAVGEWVGLGISHPCTTFDKWRTVLLLDQEDRLIEELATFF